MIIDTIYWKKIIKKIIYFIFLIISILVVLKLAYFFMPFIIALIIANCIEPLIKIICRKTKIVRKNSAKIALIVIFAIIILILALSGYLLTNETIELLKNFSSIGNNITEILEKITKLLRLENINISEEVKDLVINNTNELLNYILSYFKNFLIGILNFVTKIPTLLIYLVITILSTYFICTDRISILDNLEQRIPKKWLRKTNRHFKDITRTLGKYIKAEVILVFISFIIVLIGLFIFKALGMNISSPFLIALGIGFVDLLPILGSGTVMLPWGIITIISGDTILGISIIGLLILISTVRQFLEPRIVSSQIGMHPLYTLIAMYIGFKFSGIIGLLIGPIILIILENILKEFWKTT